MTCRTGLIGMVLLASWMGLPKKASAQEPPPVEFTGPLSNPRPEEESNSILIVLGKGAVYRSRLLIYGTENVSCYGYSDLSGICLVGLSSDIYLGSIPLGAFAAFADVEASALGAGSGVGVHWYIWEGITTSFRWDFLRGPTVTTTITP